MYNIFINTVRRRVNPSIVRRPFINAFNFNTFSTTVDELEGVETPEKLLIDTSNAILSLAQIRRECGLKFGADGVSVIGPQSGGKTSFVESLIDMGDVHDKHSGAATKRPIRAIVQNIPMGQVPYVMIGNYGEKIYDMSIFSQRSREANSGEFTSNPFEFTYATPKVPNMVITDYPGLFAFTKANEDPDLPERIMEINRPAITDDTFKIVVLNATMDVASSYILRELRQAGQLDNCMIIFTRCDMIVDSAHGRSKLIELLTDESYVRDAGSAGVVLRSSARLADGITVAEQIKYEEEFIKKHKLGKDHVPDITMGIPAVRRIIANRQLAQAHDQIPILREELLNKIDRSRRSHGMLQKLSSGKNLKEVASAMEDMVGNLHPVSSTRYLLEKKTMDNEAEEVMKAVDIAFDKYFGSINLSDLQMRDGRDKDDRSLEQTRVSVNRHPRVNPEIAKEFEKTCIFGSCATSLSEKEINAIYNANFARLAPTNFFRFEMFSYSHENRAMWVKKLRRVIDDLITNQELAENCREVGINTIIGMVEEFQPNSAGDLTQPFFEFIFRKIAERTDTDRLSDSINRMIAREKRPYAEPHELAYHTANIVGGNWKNEIGFFGTETYPKVFPVYGNVYTEAYKRILKERMVREIYRTISVNVNDDLIRETFELAFKFFEGKNFAKEQEHLTSNIDKLKEYVDVLQTIGKHTDKLHQKEVVKEEIRKKHLEMLDEERERREHKTKFSIDKLY
jgi:hypothetical protein